MSKVKTFRSILSFATAATISLGITAGEQAQALDAEIVRGKRKNRLYSLTVGDANSDGDFDSKDIQYLRERLGQSNSADLQLPSADVVAPCNGSVNEADLLHLEKAAKLRTFPNFPKEYLSRSTCHAQTEIGTRYRAKRTTPVQLKTHDTYLSKLSRRVPGFGGYHINSEGKMVLTLKQPTKRWIRATSRVMLKTFGKTFFRDKISKAGRSSIQLARIVKRKRVKRTKMEAVRGTYSFSEIHQVRENLRDNLNIFNIPGITGLDTQEQKNKIEIFFDPSKAKTAKQMTRQILQQNEIAEDMVIFTPRTFNQHHHVGASDLQEKIRPLRGGTMIRGGTGSCTMGYIVTRYNVPGLLTNAHCGSPGDPKSVIGQPDAENPIGDELINPGLNEGFWRWSDALFATLRGGVNTGLEYRRGLIGVVPDGHTAGTLWSAPGNVEPDCGTLVHKMGATTGHTSGRIGNTCSDMAAGWQDIPNTPELVQIRCQTIVESDELITSEGDSGSPAYYKLNSHGTSAVFLGLNWGGGDEHFVYSPWRNIMAELGRIDYSQGNSEPDLRIDSPRQGAMVGWGILPSIRIEGVYHDPEGFDGVVKFFSYKDGYIGQVAASSNESFSFEGPLQGGTGSRTIAVVAIDSAGNSFSKLLEVEVGNAPPEGQITTPTNGQQLFVGESFTFGGSVTDYESLGVDCSKWIWFSPDEDKFPTQSGCNPVWIPPGPAPYNISISLKAIDPVTGNESHPSKVSVSVKNLPLQGPPQNLQFLNPENNDAIAPNEIISLRASANDPDGKPLTYRFVMTQGLQETLLGSTSAPSGSPATLNWRPADDVIPNCGGAGISIKVIVSDQDNEPEQELTHELTVLYNPC